MPRKTTQTQKSKKVQDYRSIKEVFMMRKKVLLSPHKANSSRRVHKTSKKRKQKIFTSWIDSIRDKIYNGFSQMSVFISWSISWLLCFGLWAVLFYFVWQEFLWWEFL